LANDRDDENVMNTFITQYCMVKNHYAFSHS